MDTYLVEAEVARRDGGSIENSPEPRYAAGRRPGCPLRISPPSIRLPGSRGHALIRLKRVYEKPPRTDRVVYGARDEEHNEALVLKSVFERRRTKDEG